MVHFLFMASLKFKPRGPVLSGRGDRLRGQGENGEEAENFTKGGQLGRCFWVSTISSTGSFLDFSPVTPAPSLPVNRLPRHLIQIPKGVGPAHLFE